jgi:hypothetical protein
MTQQNPSSLLTFEDVDRHMQAVDVEALVDEQQTLLSGRLTETVRHLGSVYAAIRPVLAVVGALPIIPRRWRAGLDLLIGAVEGVLTIADPSFKAGRDLEEFKAGRDLEE